MSRILNHLCDNNGELGMDRMIMIAIAFVAGATLIIAIIAAITAGYHPGADSTIHNLLD